MKQWEEEGRRRREKSLASLESSERWESVYTVHSAILDWVSTDLWILVVSFFEGYKWTHSEREREGKGINWWKHLGARRRRRERREREGDNLRQITWYMSINHWCACSCVIWEKLTLSVSHTHTEGERKRAEIIVALIVTHSYGRFVRLHWRWMGQATG